MSSLVQVVDYLTQVSSKLLRNWSNRYFQDNNEPEVLLSELLEVRQGRGGDVSLPLQVPLPCLNHVAKLLVVIHVIHKRLSMIDEDNKITNLHKIHVEVKRKSFNFYKILTL